MCSLLWKSITSHCWALLDKALNLSSVSLHPGFLRGWSSRAFLYVWMSPHYWAITLPPLDQAIAAPGMQLSPVLQNLPELERETCKEKLSPPCRELPWKRCSRESFAWSLHLLVSLSLCTRCFDDLSLVPLQPIAIQTAFSDFSFQVEAEGSEAWASRAQPGTGLAGLQCIHAHGARAKHMAWAPVLWAPAAAVLTPLLHSLLLLFCSVYSLLPSDTLISGFQPSIKAPLLPFAAVWWGASTAMGAQAHISSSNSSSSPSSEPEWLHPLPSTHEMLISVNPSFLPSVWEQHRERAPCLPQQQVHFCFTLRVWQQDGKLGQPRTAPEHHGRTNTSWAVTEPLLNLCTSTGSTQLLPAHGGHTQLFFFPVREGCLTASPCSQSEGLEVFSSSSAFLAGGPVLRRLRCI